MSAPGSREDHLQDDGGEDGQTDTEADGEARESADEEGDDAHPLDKETASRKADLMISRAIASNLLFRAEESASRKLGKTVHLASSRLRHALMSVLEASDQLRQASENGDWTGYLEYLRLALHDFTQNMSAGQDIWIKGKARRTCDIVPDSVATRALQDNLEPSADEVRQMGIPCDVDSTLARHHANELGGEELILEHEAPTLAMVERANRLARAGRLGKAMNALLEPRRFKANAIQL